jgi:hypothetical protein
VPAPIDILYTTVGGVIGAALTQYVTHPRDRRAARALVIERLADVEEIFAVLRLAPPEDNLESIESPIAGKLAALESACLVAGVPRSVLTCYAASIRSYEAAHRIQNSARYVSEKMAQSVNNNATKLIERPDRENIVAILKRLSEAINHIQERANDIDKPAFRIHDEALQELSRSLWHPLILQLHWRKLRALQRAAKNLEKTSRQISETLRDNEIAYKQVSNGFTF